MALDIKQPPPKPWVKLHLAKQTDSCAMPPFIVGVLEQETPTAYLLGKVLEPEADEGHPAGYIMKERMYPDYVSRTYVYRVEILGSKPELMQFYEVPQEGGSFG